MKKRSLILYLARYGLDMSEVSRKAGISYTTINRSSMRDVTDINTRVLLALGDVLDKTPGQVFDELIETEMQDHMTIATTKIFFRKLFPMDLISVEELGGDEQVVVVEIELKGDDDSIWVAVHFGNDTVFDKRDLLSSLKYVLQSFECDDEDNLFYANTNGFDDWIEVEEMGISKESAAYFYSLGGNIGSEI